MLELYYFPNATCGMKARLVLNEKQVDYERRILDRDAGDLLTPQYRALNPNGVVPTMVHDDEVLIESSIIMNYTDDAFDGPSLKPAHPLARARMAMWMKLADERYFNSLANLTYATSQRANVLSKYRTDKEIEGYLSHVVGDDERSRRRNVLRDGIEAPEAQIAIRTLDKMLADFESVLEHSDYLAGDDYSLADAAVTPFVLRLELLDLQEMWTERRSRVDRWWKRICSRSSFEEETRESISDSYRQFLSTEGKKAWPRLKEILERHDEAGL